MGEIDSGALFFRSIDVVIHKMLASGAHRCQTGGVTKTCRIGQILLGVVPILWVSSVARAQPEPPPQHIPTDVHPPSPVRWKLVMGGLATTAGFYAVAQPFSYAWPDSPGSRDLRIPVAGPWISVTNIRCQDTDPDCSGILLWMRGIFTVLDGLGQAGGLLISLEGALLETAEPSVDPSPKPRQEPSPKDEPPPRNLFIGPTPMGVGDRGLGISVSGAF